MQKYSFSPQNERIILHNLPPEMEIQVIFNDEKKYDVLNDVYELFEFRGNKIVVKWIASKEEIRQADDLRLIRSILRRAWSLYRSQVYVEQKIDNSMEKIIDLNLPEWAFLDANCHDGNPLGDRTLLYHIRSSTVIEIFDKDFDIYRLKDDILTYDFELKSIVPERLCAAVHYCATLDVLKDRQMIIEQILKPAAKWYCDYAIWEDKGIIESEIYKLN